MKTIIMTALAAFLLAVASQVIAEPAHAPAEFGVTAADICPV